MSLRDDAGGAHAQEAEAPIEEREHRAADRHCTDLGCS
jgi:hypothetical protein